MWVQAALKSALLMRCMCWPTTEQVAALTDKVEGQQGRAAEQAQRLRDMEVRGRRAWSLLAHSLCRLDSCAPFLLSCCG